MSSSLQPALVCEDLLFQYGPRPVIKKISLRLSYGELLGVIGPNGSGKSTLLGLSSGLLSPSEGLVHLDGTPLADFSREEIARRLTLVPQFPEMAPGMSVVETVLSGRFAWMGGRLFENREDLEAAEKALSETETRDLRDRSTGTLSGGERFRAALARALAANPRVLLLDEPTSALDLRHQVGIMNLFERFCRRENRAVCVVTHDINLAAMFCDRLILISDGSVLAEGRPDDVLKPDILERAYRIRFIIDREPTRGRPRVTLIPDPVEDYRTQSLIPINNTFVVLTVRRLEVHHHNNIDIGARKGSRGKTVRFRRGPAAVIGDDAR